MKTANITTKKGEERTRNISSDSGCEIVDDSLDLHSNSLESTLRTWKVKLEEVVNQEVKRAEEITDFATKALRHCSQDDDRREKVIARWRTQMKSVLDFTNNLVESVNNDTKEAIMDTARKCTEPDYSLILEELEEEEEEECAKLLQLLNTGPKYIKLSQKNYKSGELTEKVETTFDERDGQEDETRNSRCCQNSKYEKYKNFWDEKVSFDSSLISMIDEEETNTKYTELEVGSRHPHVSSEHENDNLTNWKVWDKFGSNWDVFEDDKPATSLGYTGKKYKDINIVDVFWKISCDPISGRRQPRFLDIIHNLPVWESPDIFLDSCDDVIDRKLDKVPAEDPVNIFESIRHIFNQPNTSVKANDNHILENITNWNIFHKLGPSWDAFTVSEDSNNVLQNCDSYDDVCIVKVFWKISLDGRCCRKERSLSEVIFNLPVCDWPDVFTDDWDYNDTVAVKNDIDEQEDPINIFKTFRHIFSETLEETPPNKTDWINCDKFGKSWVSLNDLKQVDEVPKARGRKNKLSDIDILEVFWSISMDESCCIKDSRLSEVISNLPTWLGPDVFEDSWDVSDTVNEKQNKNKQKNFKRVFSGYEKFQKAKVTAKCKSVYQKVEDIFNDWMVNALETKSVKRKINSGETCLVSVCAEHGKKFRRDPSLEMAIQEYKLLQMLENLKI